MGPRQRIVVVGLLSLQAGLLSFQAVVRSPCTDEPAQMVAGISHWQTGDFTLYRVTGPLCRLIGSLPAMLLPHDMEWPGFDQHPGARPDDRVAGQYIKRHGNVILQQILLGRLAVIPFTLLGGLVCFLWSRRLWGWNAGAMSLFLWCISPHVLGQGYMMMTDISGASLYVTSAWLWWRWLEEPDWNQALLFGLTLGLLLLTKASFLVSFGTWAIVWLNWLISHRTLPTWQTMGQMVAAFGLSLYVLNAAYGFDGSFARLDSFAFVSKTLAGSHVERGESDNRFGGTPLAGIPVPLPKQYLTGVDIQKAYFDRGLRSYLNGRWQDRGWWYYYLYGYLLKTPIGTLALLGIAFITALRCTSKRCSWSHGFCLIFPPLVMLLLVSSQTGFSKNLRYAYPALPFIHILCGRVLCMNHRWLTRLACGLLAAAALESALVFPHSLSFFNAAIGSENGHRYLLHTNVDFGQDLYLLKKYLDEDGSDWRVAYYGFIDPEMVGIGANQPPSDRDSDWTGPVPGKFAVSVNLLHGHTYPQRKWQGGSLPRHREQFTYFQKFKIDDFVGYSIAIYDLTETEVNAVRAELGFTPWGRRSVADAD